MVKISDHGSQTEYSKYEPIENPQSKTKERGALSRTFINVLNYLSEFSIGSWTPLRWISLKILQVTGTKTQKSAVALTVATTGENKVVSSAQKTQSVMDASLKKVGKSENKSTSIATSKDVQPFPKNVEQTSRKKELSHLLGLSNHQDPVALQTLITLTTDGSYSPECIVEFFGKANSTNCNALLPRLMQILIEEHLDTLLEEMIQRFPFEDAGPTILRQVQAKYSDSSQEYIFLQRILNAFDSINRLETRYHNLNTIQIFRIAACAEVKIRQGSVSGVQHVRKINRTGRSLLIDYEKKEWTILSKSKKGVDILFTIGAEKKVTSGIEVRDLGMTIEVVAELTNRPGKTISPVEFEICKKAKASGRTRGLALPRVITQFLGKLGEAKQAFTQTRYFGCVSEILFSPQDIHKKQGIYFPELSLKDIKQLGLDVAYGLANLHALGYAHGDVKLENVLGLLIDGKWKFDVSDFGFAYMPDKEDANATLYGTLNYSSPEVIERYISGESKTNRKGYEEDVYAFGNLLFISKERKHPLFWKDFQAAKELFNIGFKDLANEQLNNAVIKQKSFQQDIEQLERSISQKRQNGAVTPDDELQLLIYQCMHPDPQKRPTMQVVLQRMQAIT